MVRREGAGWEGPPYYHPGRNKEAYDFNVYAIYGALKIIDQQEESNRQYAIFSDSASAVDRIYSERRGPGQRLAIAAHEVGRRITCRDNTITARWTSVHQGVEGNEVADTWAPQQIGPPQVTAFRPPRDACRH